MEAKNPTLHQPGDLFSARHVTSWFLLAFAAGSVNAGAFLACQRFVSHVTGTTTRIGVEVADWTTVAECGLVFVFFLCGAIAATFAIDARFHRGKKPLYALPLLAVVAILAAVAVTGQMGWFGPFGGEPQQLADFVLLCLLGFAMGLQNAAVTTSTGAAVRTTHMTGPTTDLGIQLVNYWISTGRTRELAARNAALRAGKVGSFITGGVAALLLAPMMTYHFFFMPAFVVLISTMLSFVPSWSALTVPKPSDSTIR